MKPTLPPEASPRLVRARSALAAPFHRLLGLDTAGGILLIVATAIALFWANSPWAASYFSLWELPIGLHAFGFSFERSLGWWVNDGLMSLFFFTVGLEIRREMHDGSLSNMKKAALPLLAALGGMLVPAGLYLLVAQAPEARPGWGASMATDIAFALGILALLGKRVPNSVRVLLLALAVIDDLGAILVIAFFYSSGVSLTGLAVAVLGLVAVWLLQRMGVRSKVAYVCVGLVVWGGVYAAGVHPTIAGVLLGLMTPVRAWFGEAGLRQQMERALAEPDLHEQLPELHRATSEALSPSESLLHTLHPWVSFAIMPLFALANAGVSLQGIELSGAGTEVMLALMVGLVLGKPLGVLAACWLGLKLKLAVLPEGVRTRELVLLGVLAGVGFTMSLFVAQLAFSDPTLLGAARLGVLSASGVAAVLSMGLGLLLLKAPKAG